ncbi:hypothetical protein BpHYR1_026158 [Brachionus plicatilis]|uniref:Uncharacterized protein n=1 Tax=Brachionus plicatilis TaxID=10195 RepID=A0A3M7T7I3_BRAPC|nr:hypothetical protein BpHYR1_026158 [Brachionus plicatilis]
MCFFDLWKKSLYRLISVRAHMILIKKFSLRILQIFNLFISKIVEFFLIYLKKRITIRIKKEKKDKNSKGSLCFKSYVVQTKLNRVRDTFMKCKAKIPDSGEQKVIMPDLEVLNLNHHFSAKSPQKFEQNSKFVYKV